MSYGLDFFEDKEFTCKCGCGKNEMQRPFLKKLDNARSLSDVLYVINSGDRCKKHNKSKEVRGSSTSSHLLGWAVDIKCPSSHYRYKIIEGLILAGIKRIGIGRTFIHTDDDPAKDPEVAFLY